MQQVSYMLYAAPNKPDSCKEDRKLNRFTRLDRSLKRQWSLKNSYRAFIDFRSAFDTVDRPSLWLILKAASLPTDIVSLFKEIYSNTESAVLVNGKLSSSFPMHNGVRQGCAAAPELFNCIADDILNETHHANPFAISYAGRTLSDVDFTDDIAALSDNLDQFKPALETLSSTASRVGLQINWKKTKIMPIEKTAAAPLSTVEINGKAVDVVEQFTYLDQLYPKEEPLTQKSQPDLPRQALCSDDSWEQSSTNRK